LCGGPDGAAGKKYKQKYYVYDFHCLKLQPNYKVPKDTK